MMENHCKKHADEPEIDFVAVKEEMWTIQTVPVFIQSLFVKWNPKTTKAL